MIPGISGDGRYVAFYSPATNLVAADTNGTWDVFLRDNLTNTTSRITVDSSGAQGTGGGMPAWASPALSSDGRYIAYESSHSNLVPGDTNSNSDIFLRDITSNVTTRISTDSADAQAIGGNSFGPAITSDGRYVAFYSYATNLIAGDTNGTMDVFVKDTVTGTTSRVSVDSTGTQANSGSQYPVISSNGRYVAFESGATNLVAGDTNALSDIFVRDTVLGITTRISVDSAGTQANGNSYAPAISADGRYIAYYSAATNLVAGDTNGRDDIFVRDTVANTTTRVSVDSSGNQSNHNSQGAAISADGRYIVFHSFASNLVAGDTNGQQDVFIRDTVLGTTVRVNVDASGNQATGGSSGSNFKSLSSNGYYIVFSSDATNLVTSDTNATTDIFLYSLQ